MLIDKTREGVHALTSECVCFVLQAVPSHPPSPVQGNRN